MTLIMLSYYCVVIGCDRCNNHIRLLLYTFRVVVVALVLKKYILLVQKQISSVLILHEYLALSFQPTLTIFLVTTQKLQCRNILTGGTAWCRNIWTGATAWSRNISTGATAWSRNIATVCFVYVLVRTDGRTECRNRRYFLLSKYFDSAQRTMLVDPLLSLIHSSLYSLSNWAVLLFILLPYDVCFEEKIFHYILMTLIITFQLHITKTPLTHNKHFSSYITHT